jgi:putative membrane protein
MEVPMPLVASLAALLAAAFHVLFFVLESVTFSQPSVAARFGMTTPEQIAAVRPMAFNQGFYNLFLAVGIVGGLALVAAGSVDAGRAVVLFACACMVGAGLVLLSTNRRFVRSAAIQALPPLVAIVGALALR